MNGLTVPPSGKRTICIDFDGVIIPFVSDLYADVKPLFGAATAIRSFAERGFRIVILTSRMSHEWWMAENSNVANAVSFGIAQRNYVEGILRKNDIPYDLVTSEKVPALLYLDDRAIYFNGDWGVATDAVEDAVAGTR